jgi:hypothetical protein
MNHDDLAALVRSVRPSDADRVDDLFSRARQDELFNEIVRAPTGAQAVGPRRARPDWMPRLRAPNVGRPRVARRLAVLGAAVTLASVAAIVIAHSPVHPQNASAAVVFRGGAGGEIVATVVDPFAAQDQLDAEFAARGFDITVNLVPVSPSLVGTIIYTSDNGGASAIQALQGGPCVTGGGGCPIGLRIPASFSGGGYITLGRPAEPGETYQSQTSAFAPGEALHCSGLLGAQVGASESVLRSDKLAVTWRAKLPGSGPNGTSAGYSASSTPPPADDYIWDALMTAPGMVMIWAEPQPWPDDASHGAAFNRGC